MDFASNPHPLPALPLHGVYIDRCITYETESSGALTRLKGTLSQASSQVRCNIHREDGIELEIPPPKPETKKRRNDEFYDLPPPPKKVKYSGRHGKKANENKKLTGVKIGIDHVSKLAPSVPSEIDVSQNFGSVDDKFDIGISPSATNSPREKQARSAEDNMCVSFSCHSDEGEVPQMRKPRSEEEDNRNEEKEEHHSDKANRSKGKEGNECENDDIEAICESNTTGEEEVSVEDDICVSSSCHSSYNEKEVPQMGSTTEHPQDSSVHASVLTTEEKQEYENEEEEENRNKENEENHINKEENKSKGSEGNVQSDNDIEVICETSSTRKTEKRKKKERYIRRRRTQLLMEKC